MAVGEEAQVEGDSKGELSLSQHTLMPDPGSTGTTETTPTSKVAVLTKNRLFRIPNGILMRVGLVYSTTTMYSINSASNATIPTTMIPSSSQAGVQPFPPTQNPTGSSPSLSPSPSHSQRLLKGLTARSSQSFYTGTFNSTHSASMSGFSVYDTPDASMGSFSSEAGLGLIRRSEVGGGAGSSRYSDVGTERDKELVWDRETDGRLEECFEAGVEYGLEEGNGSGSDDEVYDTVRGDFTANEGSHNTDELEEGSYCHLRSSQPTLATTTTASGSSTTTTALAQSSTSGSTSTGATSVGNDKGDKAENQNENMVGNGTGNESERPGVRLLPSLLRD
ncbi:hypothetical protein BJ165DRAFT_1532649 [Panaeolus papilionaceus]|nr:hypothetical protein BJ165DRAFT_1532649 [Panaeolus papilionaceus]